jgi:putative transcriptional regulator
MRHPPLEALRAHARGEGDAARRVLVEAHAVLCQACAELLARDDQAPRLPDALPPGSLEERRIEPPPFEQVWTTIERLRARRGPGGLAALPPGVLAVLPDIDRARWIIVSLSGVRVTLVLRDAETGSTLYLAHCPRASRFPAHRHLGSEENLIIAGACENGDSRLEAGDWMAAAPGTEHSVIAGPDRDCWCLSRIEPPGVRFFGWRRWLQA